MAKRKLTRKQSWRVKKIQNERTERMRKQQEKQDRLITGGDLGPEQEGLVITHYGSQLDIECLNDHQKGVIFRCHLRANIEGLVTGDRVVWRAGKEFTGIIVASLPRHSVLNRPDTRGKLKPIAANIDQIIVVFSPLPKASSALLDRYLVAVELSQIEPILLLNKYDLIDEDEQHLIPMIQRYRDIGYTVLTSSTKKHQGLNELQSLLDQRISVFVGQSGVGKSSLVNSLLPGTELKIGEVSENSGLGIHTTTSARLFHLPGGGELIDSPGIREFGLWHLKPDELIDGFKEFTPFVGLCKFRDCNHDKEPGCAILKAVKDGDITSLRFDNYRQILQALSG
ncbi:MAG: small ribosomal subunit biogenesis GTPase RsgA [Pseudomonadales bacterium]|nr:small ribosomal subunit biogenesis GTPase RsgA [Pseudomonadales bacterium]